jgi:hypothetical protein
MLHRWRTAAPMALFERDAIYVARTSCDTLTGARGAPGEDHVWREVT